MIDKPFLEQELKRLLDVHAQTINAANQKFTRAQQIDGAIQMVQGLLKKAEDEAAGEQSPAVVPSATPEV